MKEKKQNEEVQGLLYLVQKGNVVLLGLYHEKVKKASRKSNRAESLSLEEDFKHIGLAHRESGAGGFENSFCTRKLVAFK